MYDIEILYLVKEPRKEPNFWHFPKRQILDCPILKEFADDIFKFNENGRKFAQMGGKYCWKGEIAPYEQLLLFPQCFQKA